MKKYTLMSYEKVDQLIELKCNFLDRSYPDRSYLDPSTVGGETSRWRNVQGRNVQGAKRPVKGRNVKGAKRSVTLSPTRLLTSDKADFAVLLRLI